MSPICDCSTSPSVKPNFHSFPLFLPSFFSIFFSMLQYNQPHGSRPNAYLQRNLNLTCSCSTFSFRYNFPFSHYFFACTPLKWTGPCHLLCIKTMKHKSHLQLLHFALHLLQSRAQSDRVRPVILYSLFIFIQNVGDHTLIATREDNAKNAKCAVHIFILSRPITYKSKHP